MSLTLVLVAATIFYAWQTRQTVKAMWEARRLTILPKVAVDLRIPYPTFGIVVVKNVGHGPALDVNLSLGFSPTDAKGNPEERRWRTNLLAAGEEHRFYPPAGSAGQLMNMDELVLNYCEIWLKGIVLDAFRKQDRSQRILDESPRDMGPR